MQKAVEQYKENGPAEAGPPWIPTSITLRELQEDRELQEKCSELSIMALDREIRSTPKP